MDLSPSQLRVEPDLLDSELRWGGGYLLLKTEGIFRECLGDLTEEVGAENGERRTENRSKSRDQIGSRIGRN